MWFEPCAHPTPFRRTEEEAAREQHKQADTARDGKWQPRREPDRRRVKLVADRCIDRRQVCGRDGLVVRAAGLVGKRLRPTEWAKSASVPVTEIYAYLSGRSRAISAASAERLAKAARASLDEMFGRKVSR